MQSKLENLKPEEEEKPIDFVDMIAKGLRGMLTTNGKQEAQSALLLFC